MTAECVYECGEALSEEYKNVKVHQLVTQRPSMAGPQDLRITKNEKRNAKKRAIKN